MAVAYLGGDRLISGGWDSTVAVWDFATQAEIARHNVGHPVLSLAVSPDGERIALGGSARFGVGRDVDAIDPSSVLPEPPRGSVLALAWSRDGQFVAGVNHRDRYHVYEPGRGLHRPLNTSVQPLAVSFSDSGELLLVSSTKVLIARPPALEVQELASPLPLLQTGALSPDGRWVALGGNNGALTILDRRGGSIVDLPGHRRALLGLVFSHDGTFLLSVCYVGEVRIWDVGSWKERTNYDWDISSIRAVAIAPDGMTAVAAGFDGTLLLWDLDGL
jgi:WD40 repeat protein